MVADWEPQLPGDKEGDSKRSPGDPDYDLSEEGGYAGWEPGRSFLLSRWPVVAISLLLALVMLLAILVRLR